MIFRVLWTLLTVGTFVASRALNLNPSQAIATTIFMSLIYGTLFFWEFRLGFAFFGLSLLLAFKVTDIHHVIQFAGLDIILFLIGMMVVIGFLEERKFFDHIVERLAIWVGPKAYRLMTVMMVAAFISAALVDEVTSIMFMTTTLLLFLKKAKVTVIPFVMMVVFATNIGSSATVVGNPIGVLIAMNAHLTFFDFIRWAFPPAFVSLLVCIPLCFLIFQKPMKELDKRLSEQHVLEKVGKIEEQEEKRFAPDLPLAWLIFGVTILGLILHSHLEGILGLEKNTLLIGVALLMAGICLFISGDKARELVEKRVDWWTLSFFLVLFASVGTLQYVGVTSLLAKWIVDVAGGNPLGILFAFTMAVAVLTAVMDNVLAVATFIPMVHDVGSQGYSTTPIWWGILMGGTFWGNFTLIGSTANIVVAGMLEKRKEGKLTFMTWIVPGAIVSIVTLAVAMTILYFQIPLMPK